MNKCLVLLAALVAPIAARAELFADLRAGAAFTDDGDITLSTPFGSLGLESDFDDSVTGGLRLGYWLDAFPWLGVAAEASYFGPDVPSGGPDIDVIPVSPLLMGRVPIARDEEYSHGRLQPFLAIGPGIFISELDSDGYSDEEVDVGLDLHVGLKFFVVPSVALFAQYRFTSFEPEYSDEVFVPFPASVDTEVELDTHHVAGGIAFHF